MDFIITEITFFLLQCLQMYHEVKDGNVLTVNHVKNVLRREYPYADVQSILGVHSEYDEGRKVCWELNGKKYCSLYTVESLRLLSWKAAKY